MSGEKIFVVEDERIVAEDLMRMLAQLGYQVTGSAASGDEALQKMRVTRPDLVLMDIRIQGPLDGIDVAEHVVAEFDVPVIYLTAYADETTVDRAKGTLAAGYILKPFEERGLKTTIDLALYRHKMDRLIKGTHEWHGGILGTLHAAVLATDENGAVTYMNQAAEELTGHLLEQVLGKPVKEVLITDNPRVISVPSYSIVKGDRRIPIDAKRSVVTDREGNVTGDAFLLSFPLLPEAPFPGPSLL